MNYRLIIRLLGKIMLIEAAAMLAPLIVSVIYHDGMYMYFIAVIAALLILGFLLGFGVRHKNSHMQPRDGFFAVALIWVVLSLFGAIPDVISRVIPSYLDALFESVAGFTTTGSSIIANIESLPKSIVFWRSLTQWIGGMGVLILTLAVLPAGDRGVHNLMRAEAPGPASDRIVPRLRKTAIILYSIYLCLSVLQALFLMLGDMNVFDALVHTFATAGTGGFSSRTLSIGSYKSAYLEYTIAVFMMFYGINFGIYFSIISKRYLQLRQNTEIKVYLGIIATATLLIAANLFLEGGYDSVELAARHSFFHVTSIVSTTAFAATDYNLWPDFSKMLLIFLMIVGACSGSTGGGMKIARLVILVKSAVRELKKILHPRSVNLVMVNGKSVPDEVLAGVTHFFSVYIIIVVVGTILISLDNHGLVSSFTAVLASISNVGIGLETIGPYGNYAAFSGLSKLVLIICMFVGRLEIFPVLMLFVPAAWKRA